MHSLVARAFQVALIAWLSWGLLALYAMGYVLHLALELIQFTLDPTTGTLRKSTALIL